MRTNKNILLVFFMLSSIIFSGGWTDAEAQVLANKTITRWVDPVVVKGSLIKELTGVPLANVRLYAFQNGSFQPIRYQIDEMTKEGGDWVFPDGPLATSEMSNGKFDTWDMLLFMAKDTGDKVSIEAWTPGYTKGIEIEVTDPINGQKGWCYLLYFASNPPPRSSEPDYVVYSYVNEYVETEFYKYSYIVTKDGFHTTYYKNFLAKQAAGGNGQNFVDRLKIRPTFKLLFGGITLKFNEELLKSTVIGYKKGPIRLNRRLEHCAVIPGGIKAIRAVTDIMFYPYTATCPIMFNIPFKLDTVFTSAVVRAGTDYSPAVIGGHTYSSTNPQGFLVDGKMDDGENNFNSEPDTWRLLTGGFGTFMTRNLFPPEALKGLKLSMGIIDDTTKTDSPEAYPGCIGFIWQDWDATNVNRGPWKFFLEFYTIPHYKPGVETEFTNYMDQPLKIKVGTYEETNSALLFPEVCEEHKEYRGYGKTVKIVKEYNKKMGI